MLYFTHSGTNDLKGGHLFLIYKQQISQVPKLEQIGHQTGPQIRTLISRVPVSAVPEFVCPTIGKYLYTDCRMLAEKDKED